jgi:hypothetical protein
MKVLFFDERRWGRGQKICQFILSISHYTLSYPHLLFSIMMATGSRGGGGGDA